jgi:ABC-type dipeptide/oligopeptide/nickel transport system ATPase component
MKDGAIVVMKDGAIVEDADVVGGCAGFRHEYARLLLESGI